MRTSEAVLQAHGTGLRRWTRNWPQSVGFIIRFQLGTSGNRFHASVSLGSGVISCHAVSGIGRRRISVSMLCRRAPREMPKR